MYPTVETRWFYPGTIPPDVRAWFRQGERQPREQPRRVDYYLHLTDQDALGVKLREGGLEIKQRHRAYGLSRFHRRVAGQVEQWHKWRFELANLDLPDAPWVGVEKVRQLCRYRLTGDGQVVAAALEDPVDRGCDLELAQVGVGEKVWWSLNLETFGDASGLQENLLLVARHLFAEAPPLLEARHSCGYPEWLSRIARADTGWA